MGEHERPSVSEELLSTPKSVLNEDDEIPNEDDGTSFEEDDGLGYYPDGVKRTLTDEQVAMFRHSEIYSLIRKRQIQKENHDADNIMNPRPPNPGSPCETAVTVGPKHESGDDDDSNDDEEYLKFMEAERKQMEAEYASKKRKFSRVDGCKPRNKAPTHRRIARELDDAVMSHDVLDYGEGASETPELAKEHSHDDRNSELKDMISESSPTYPTACPTAVHDLPKGRKIWWPTIEKR